MNTHGKHGRIGQDVCGLILVGRANLRTVKSIETEGQGSVAIKLAIPTVTEAVGSAVSGVVIADRRFCFLFRRCNICNSKCHQQVRVDGLQYLFSFGAGRCQVVLDKPIGDCHLGRGP